MIEKPMNPYAERDFTHAMREAGEAMSKKFEDFSEELKRIGEQMKANVADAKISFIDFADMPTGYNGVMRLNHCGGIGAWQDIVNTLIAHGYEVTMRLEDATEIEREVDGADKFIVIEYGEVE